MKEWAKFFPIFSFFYVEIKNQFDTSIKIICSDNAKKSFTNSFQFFFFNNDILHRSSCPYTHSNRMDL